MVVPSLPSRALVWMPLLALSACLAGCGARGAARPPATPSERGTALSAEVSDDGFSSAIHDLILSTPRTSERAARLGAVEAHQMTRADARFKSRAIDRGLAAVSGGLYLLHAGEPTRTTFGERGMDALKASAREVSSRGDEGRARALFDLLVPLVPDAEGADVKGHLDALDAWMHDAVATGGFLASGGALERVAVRRRLFEPSQAALSEADKAISEWIRRAMALRDTFRKTRVQPAREEGAEAWRALETGPVVLAGIYLRDADVAGAVGALERARARDLLESERPQLASALESMARERTADRCVELLAQLRPLTGHEPGRDDEDFVEDRDLFVAASFALAGECYRLDPRSPQAAFSLGVALEELGMAEATPAVLVEAVRAHPEAKVVSEALALTLDAMAGEEEASDPDAARRAFRAAQPLLLVASQASLSARVHPSAAQLRAGMGEIELRSGRLDEARALFKQSAEQERSGTVLLSLARIEWWAGQTQPALDHLRAALASSDAARDVALRGEVLLAISDVTREKGDIAGARTPLTEALTELVRSRGAREASVRSRIERVLARVLDRFGAEQPAARALERAYVAAAGDKHQAAQTIELLVGRAFVRGDLAGARESLQRGVAADLDGDDIVYFALWVRLLERQLRVVTDGAPDRVFASVPDDGRWIGTLGRFGEGKLKGNELAARATTPIQRAEALFYDAMDRRAAGDTKAGDELLRQVAAGPGLELSEVTLARDILDPKRAIVGGPLPPDVSIP